MPNALLLQGFRKGADNADGGSWTSAGISFLLLVAALLTAFLDAAISMATIWTESSVYHHGLAVLPISAGLIAARRDWMRLAPNADWIGVPVIASASLLWILGRAASVDLLGHLALVVSVVGAVVAVYGRALASSWRFPLSFLLFMVPAGAELTPTLQLWGAHAVAAMLNFTGIETARDGFLFTTDAGRFEMAESCAGLRFLFASAIIASVVSWLAFADWRKRAMFVATALFAALTANWLRAYAIVFVATITERRIGVGPEHVMLGWVFYCLLIIMLIALARRFADAPRNVVVPVLRQARTPQSRYTAILAALIAPSIAVAYDAAIVSNVPANADRASESGRPRVRVEGGTRFWSAYSPNADGLSTVMVGTSAGDVFLSRVSFDYDRRGGEIAGGDTKAADGSVWRRVAVARRNFEIEGASPSLPVETISNDSGERLDVATYYLVDRTIHFNPVSAKIDVAARKLSGRRTSGEAHFVAAPAPGDAAISQFLGSLTNYPPASEGSL